MQIISDFPEQAYLYACARTETAELLRSDLSPSVLKRLQHLGRRMSAFERALAAVPVATAWREPEPRRPYAAYLSYRLRPMPGRMGYIRRK